MNKHKTARGREFNMQAFAAEQGGTIAVGNSSRNGRGDLIGAGGKVIATADQIDIKTPRSVSKNADKKVKINPAEYEMGRRDIVGADGVTRVEVTYADGSVEIQEKQKTTQPVAPESDPFINDDTTDE